MIRPQVGRTVEAAWATLGGGATVLLGVGALLAATWLGRDIATPVGPDTGRNVLAAAGPADHAAAGVLGADAPLAAGPAATLLTLPDPTRPGAPFTQAASLTFPPPIAPRAPLPEPGTRPSTPPRPVPAATPSQPDPVASTADPGSWGRSQTKSHTR